MIFNSRFQFLYILNDSFRHEFIDLFELDYDLFCFNLVIDLTFRRPPDLISNGGYTRISWLLKLCTTPEGNIQSSFLFSNTFFHTSECFY